MVIRQLEKDVYCAVLCDDDGRYCLVGLFKPPYDSSVECRRLRQKEFDSL